MFKLKGMSFAKFKMTKFLLSHTEMKLISKCYLTTLYEINDAFTNIHKQLNVQGHRIFKEISLILHVVDI